MIGGLIKNGSRCLLAGTSAIAILLSGATVARAADVQQLESAMRAMQAQMQEMQREIQEAKAQAASAKAAASSSGGGASDLDLKVKWRGAPELSSSDGKFKFKIRGRIMTDFSSIDQDRRITDEQDVNAVELRRARFGVEGTVFYDWKYKFEADFAANEVALKDVYVAYANWIKDIDMSEVRFGNYYVYTSTEQVTSSRFITFMERAAFVDAFFPTNQDRQIGAGVLLGGEHWSFQSGYYGAGVDTQETFFDDATAFSVRGTVAPINNETTVLHLSGAYRHRDAGTERETDAARLFDYRTRGADLHLADRFIDTPNLADSDDMFVLGGAFVWRSLSVQGEYAQLETEMPISIGRENPTYSGWYVDASWYITGEMRNYEASTGEFGRTKVRNPVYGGSGGWGAWQIAGRYDTLDLSDKSAAIADAGLNCNECGEQNTWLVGLNWLLTDYTAIKLNVTQSEIKGGVNDGAEITGVGLRAQVDW